MGGSAKIPGGQFAPPPPPVSLSKGLAPPGPNPHPLLCPGADRDLKPGAYCANPEAGLASMNFVLMVPGMLLAGVIIVVAAKLMPESHSWTGSQDQVFVVQCRTCGGPRWLLDLHGRPPSHCAGGPFCPVLLP